MGGATIRVPEGWTVDVRAAPIMGGVRDRRERRSRHPGSAAHRHPRLYHDGRPQHQVVRLPAGKTHMSTDTRLNLTPQFVIGVCLILFGALLTLDRLQLVDAAVSLRYWPVVLIALGGLDRGRARADGPQLARLRDDRHRFPAAPGLVRRRAGSVLGAVLAAHHRARRHAPDHAHARAHRRDRHRFGQSPDTQGGAGTLPIGGAAGTINMFSVLGGSSAPATTSHSAAGKSPSFLGGTHLDLRQATIEPGEQAVINVFAMMGGHEVWVPSGWTVVLDVMPILGNVEDKRLPALDPTPRPPNEAAAATRPARRRRHGWRHDQELMHPILEDRRRLALYLLAWLLVGLLLAVGLRSDAAWATSAAFLLPLCFVYAFIGLSTWYLCRAFPIGGRSSWSTLIVVQIDRSGRRRERDMDGAGIFLGGRARRARCRGSARSRFTRSNARCLFVVGALLYWLAAACHYLLVAFQTSRDAETRAFEQTLLAREAELRALRAQIDPHFIFNSLHSISALTTTDAAAARKMCLLLADFLRDTLRLGSSSRISFADEWSLAERFLAIEQVRLGSRLHVARESDPQAAGCPVPPLLLQPLVENAVIHGMAQLDRRRDHSDDGASRRGDADRHGREPLRSRSPAHARRRPRARAAEEAADDGVRRVRCRPRGGTVGAVQGRSADSGHRAADS